MYLIDIPERKYSHLKTEAQLAYAIKRLAKTLKSDEHLTFKRVHVLSTVKGF